MIKEDDTLMAVYPKIKGVPDFRMKEHYRRELSKIYAENTEVDQARKELNRRNLKRE